MKVLFRLFKIVLIVIILLAMLPIMALPINVCLWTPVVCSIVSYVFTGKGYVPAWCIKVLDFGGKSIDCVFSIKNWGEKK